jgi:hypothetical protein
MKWGRSHTLRAVKVLHLRAIRTRCLIEVESLAACADFSKVDDFDASMAGDRGEVVRAQFCRGTWHCRSDCYKSRDDYGFGGHFTRLSDESLVQR